MGIHRRASKSSGGSVKSARSYSARLADNSNDSTKSAPPLLTALADNSVNSVCSIRTADSLREAQTRLAEMMDDYSEVMSGANVGSTVTVKEARCEELAAQFNQCKLGDQPAAASAVPSQVALQQAPPMLQAAVLPMVAMGFPVLVPAGGYAGVPINQMTSAYGGRPGMTCSNGLMPGASGCSGQSKSTPGSPGKVRKTVNKDRNAANQSSLTEEEKRQKRFSKREYSVLKFKSSPMYYEFENHPYAAKNWHSEPNPRDETLKKRPWERMVAKWRGSWRRINAVCQLMGMGYQEKACEHAWSSLGDTEVEQDDSEEHAQFQERKHSERVAQAAAMLC